MTVTELKSALLGHEEKNVRIELPDGAFVPAHFHVTEVAFVKKDFIDCGGTVRHEGKCQLQVWLADDYDHRVSAERFLKILEHGKPVIPTEALPVELEYEHPVISQFPLHEVKNEGDTLTLVLTGKNTDCLAKEVCGVAADRCEPGSGCC